MKNTFTFNLYKTELFGRYWKPQSVKAVIVIVHGMGEHIGRYENSVVPELLKNGFAVVGFDQFGHGKTTGKRGHCPSYEALLETIDVVIKKAESLFSNKRIFLYGHSMGGNLVINYALRKNHNLKGVIATSPFLRLAFQPPKWKMVLGKAMLHIFPAITLPSALDVDAISRNPEEVKRYKDDVLIHDKVSPMFTFPVIDAGNWAIENADKLNIPILVLHGKSDRIIDYQGSQDFCKNTNFATLKLFENAYHELHHDLCNKELMHDITHWVKSINSNQPN